VLLARAAGKPLSHLVAERITGPLGMTATGFGTPDTGRLATAYRPGPGGLEVLDPPAAGSGTSPGAGTFDAVEAGQVEVLADERTRTVKAQLSRDHELIYPPVQEFWDAAVGGTS
jgi:CubicO group peptidase (beta-lactamase class C family)